jgi:4-alpha-glucanotransferase
MFDYTLSEIKKELKSRSHEDIVDLCLQLAKYKKDNKEYLGFLLYDAEDISHFLQDVLKNMDQMFDEIANQTHWYQTKKSWRKILRQNTKCAKFMKSKSSEIHMLLHFVKRAQSSQISYARYNALTQIVELQIKKIRALIPTVHEDLQYDFNRELATILEAH